MPGRSFSSPNYRFGFNGKENDNEVKGITGSQQDYGFRVYDPRLGRFLSVDPLTSKYAMLTPYQFASNRPIDCVDLDGLEGIEYLRYQRDCNRYGPAIADLKEIWESMVANYQRCLYGAIQMGSERTERSEEYNTYAPPIQQKVDNIRETYEPVSNFSAGVGQMYSDFTTLLGAVEFASSFIEETCSNVSRIASNAILEEPSLIEEASLVNETKSGTIYEVPGEGTSSGKPYVGRHNKSTPQITRKSLDGRDRSQCKVIDTYDSSDPIEGQYKEQKAIDERGGVEKLDNKRREVSIRRMKDLERKYGNNDSSN